MVTAETPVIAPKMLILPKQTKDDTSGIGATEGCMVISGAKLFFYNGSAWEIVTSATI